MGVGKGGRRSAIIVPSACSAVEARWAYWGVEAGSAVLGGTWLGWTKMSKRGGVLFFGMRAWRDFLAVVLGVLGIARGAIVPAYVQ